MVFLTYLNADDHFIVFHDTYGANYKVSLILERMGIEITWLNADDAAQWWLWTTPLPLPITRVPPNWSPTWQYTAPPRRLAGMTISWRVPSLA